MSGLPILEFADVFEFAPLFDTQGSTSNAHAAFYRPVIPDGYFLLGDYGQPDYYAPGAIVQCVSVSQESGAPALAPPAGWRLAWDNRGMFARTPGSFWMPVPPAGYVACGHVAQQGYDEPSIANFRCVREDLAVPMPAVFLIWSAATAQGSTFVFNVPYLNDLVIAPAFDGGEPPNVRVPQQLANTMA